MRAAILQCDEVAERFRPRFGDYAGMIRRLFQTTGETIDWELFDCRREQYPADPAEYDFFITTGSRASAYDPDPWIGRLIAFIRRLDADGRVLIGICFGHQAIAMAGHGRVERSARGWGLGLSRNRLAHRPPWMADAPEELRMIVSHQDQVTALAGSPLVIAESDFCPYFMVQWNDHFLSVQGHPEWRPDYARALLEDRRAELPPERVEAAFRSLEEAAPDNATFARWALAFIRDRA